MHDAARTAARLYAAFARKDGDAMAGCYAADATFSDPVFPDLRGKDVGAMWRMLCGRARDLRIDAATPELLPDGRVRVAWQAWYTFGATGRPVHNQVTATLRVEDGRIAGHEDAFDFPAWAAQALGWKGRLLGRTRFLRHKVQRQAAGQLARFRAKQGGALVPDA